jgi:hypothetical protein
MSNRKYGLFMLSAWVLTNFFVNGSFAQSEINRPAAQSQTERQSKDEANRARNDGRGIEKREAADGNGRDSGVERTQRTDRTRERDRRHRDSK